MEYKKFFKKTLLEKKLLCRFINDKKVKTIELKLY